MAGKGGAWKVAYADFVTAMMAFFLVMWLISQDQKVREGIARYFMDPVGLRLFDGSTTPATAGGMMDVELAGPVPGSRLRTAGRGLGDTQDSIDHDNETQIVNEWLFDDADWSRRWQPLAREQLRKSRALYPADPDGKNAGLAEDHAAKQLAMRLQQLVREDGDSHTAGMFKELMIRSVSRVEWERVAHECLWEIDDAEASGKEQAPSAPAPASSHNGHSAPHAH
jgi:chemotaxis protein MotB